MTAGHDPSAMRLTPAPAMAALHETWSRLRSTWWAFVAVPSVLAVFIAGFVRLLPEDLHAFTPLVGISVIASLSVGFGIVASHTVLIWGCRRWWVTKNPSRLPHLLAYAVGTVLGAELTFALAPSRWIELLQLEGLRWPFWGLAAVIIVVVTSIHGSLERLREQARASERLAQERQRAAMMAELSALQARTQPHFLFNALSLVATLIEEDPVQATVAVERLSNLLRYTMRGAHQMEVPLSREVSAVRDYLELQQMRFGERLRFRIHCVSDADRILVLPMMIQPLVENSVNHAVARRRSGASIVVDIRAAPEQIEIEVSDDGPGANDVSSHGSAHENLRHRLRLHYAERATFEVKDRVGVGYAVTVRLPRREGATPWNDSLR